jgi:hypothetical protein
VQGVLEKRVGGYTLGAVANAFDAPLFGYGIGLGTNVGAMRATGKKQFLIGEGAWPATIGELGPILGLMLLGVRIALGASLLRRAWGAARTGNSLPLTMGGFAVILVVMGDTAQPTALGFFVLGAGLMLAACNPTVGEVLARKNALRGSGSPARDFSSASSLRQRIRPVRT